MSPSRSFGVGPNYADRHSLTATFAAFLLLVSISSVGSAAADHGVVPRTAGTPSDLGVSANGNFSIGDPQPPYSIVPGTYLRAQYAITVVTAPSNRSPLEVWVPQAIVTFYGSNTTQRFFHSPVTMNFTADGPTVSNVTNLTSLATFSGYFNQSTRAVLSSQAVALMVNRPFGSVTLSVSWRWLLAFPDGSVVLGPWTAGTLLAPATYAELVTWGPSPVTPGGSFAVCIGGPIEGRNFSLHLDVAVSGFDFAEANYSAPANGASPVCWSATVPAWIQPQGIVAQIWNYNRVTLLLYAIKVTVAAASSPLSMFFAPVYSIGGAVTAASLAVGSGALAVTLLRWRPWRRRRAPLTKGEAR